MKMPIALIATIKLFARLRFLRPSAAKIARRAIETIENVEQRCARARYAALVPPSGSCDSALREGTKVV